MVESGPRVRTSPPPAVRSKLLGRSPLGAAGAGRQHHQAYPMPLAGSGVLSSFPFAVLFRSARLRARRRSLCTIAPLGASADGPRCGPEAFAPLSPQDQTDALLLAPWRFRRVRGHHSTLWRQPGIEFASLLSAFFARVHSEYNAHHTSFVVQYTGPSPAAQQMCQ